MIGRIQRFLVTL